MSYQQCQQQDPGQTYLPSASEQRRQTGDHNPAAGQNHNTSNPSAPELRQATDQNHNSWPAQVSMNHSPAQRQQVALSLGSPAKSSHLRTCQILSPECLPPPQPQPPPPPRPEALVTSLQQLPAQNRQQDDHPFGVTFSPWQQRGSAYPSTLISQSSQMVPNHTTNMMISPGRYQQRPPMSTSSSGMLAHHSPASATLQRQAPQHSHLGGQMRHSLLGVLPMIGPTSADRQLYAAVGGGQSAYIDGGGSLPPPPIQFVRPIERDTQQGQPFLHYPNYRTDSLGAALQAPQQTAVQLVESNSSASTSAASTMAAVSSSSCSTATNTNNSNSLDYRTAKEAAHNSGPHDGDKRSLSETVDSGLKAYLTQLILASNVPFAYTIILVAFLITMIAATSIITMLTIVLTLTGYTAYPVTENTFNTSLAIGISCATFALVLVTGSLIIWRRHCNAAYYYLDEPQDNSRDTNSPQLSVTYDDSEYGSVPVTDWIKHVQKLHADGDIGFAREFEQIQQASQKQNASLTCDHSQLPENKHKNRYINIVAYDHTRVVLRPPLGGPRKPGYDYINANFIDVSNRAK
jgi:hypothetical protein